MAKSLSIEEIVSLNGKMAMIITDSDAKNGFILQFEDGTTINVDVDYGEYLPEDFSPWGKLDFWSED